MIIQEAKDALECYTETYLCHVTTHPLKMTPEKDTPVKQKKRYKPVRDVQVSDDEESGDEYSFYYAPPELPLSQPSDSPAGAIVAYSTILTYHTLSYCTVYCK